MGWLADLLLPHRCAVCRALGASPCPPCRAALPPAPPAPPPPGVERCASVVAYQGTGRALVGAVKYHGDRGPLRWVAAEIADALRAGPAGAGGASPVAVTWVPSAAGHRRQRGADGAELLARAVGAALGVPAAGLLRRGPGPPQVGRTAAERLAGPHLACAAAPAGGVLVVDDVVTTGGSVAAAARALRRGGAAWVWAGSIARTPPPGAGPPPLKPAPERSDN